VRPFLLLLLIVVIVPPPAPFNDGQFSTLEIKLPSNSRQPIVFELTDAVPWADVYMVVGTSLLNVPMKGGCALVPTPDVRTLWGTTDGRGNLNVEVSSSIHIPKDMKIYLQMWYRNRVSTSGWEASNGITLAVP